MANVGPKSPNLPDLLTNSTKMIKFPSKTSSKPEERLVKVDLDRNIISWESRKRKADLRQVDFLSIKEIRPGQHTKTFSNHGKIPEYQDRSFSVIYIRDNQYKTLDLGNDSIKQIPFKI
jgi:hypothetical protein